jgi:hypothetical protein
MGGKASATFVTKPKIDSLNSTTSSSINQLVTAADTNKTPSLTAESRDGPLIFRSHNISAGLPGSSAPPHSRSFHALPLFFCPI